jgi:sugar phosphate permease
MAEWRRKILVSTWLAYAGLYFCRKPFYNAKATLAEELHLDLGQLGDIGAAYLVAYTIGQFLAAWLGQRNGARVVLLTGIAGSILCNVVFAFANNYWTLLAFMALNGLAQATGWSTVVGTVGHWTRRKERGTVMGFWGTCYQLGGIFATSWSAFWLVRHGIKGAFLAPSAVLLVVWFVVFRWQRNRPEDIGQEPLEPQEATDGSGAGGPPRWTRGLIINVALLGAFYFGVKFVRYAVWSWTPFLLQNNFGLEADDAGYLSTVFDWAGFAGVVVAGVASDRIFGGKRTLPSFLMLIGMMFGCGLLYLVGGTSLMAFASCLGLIGFMLFGPDSLLSGAGAVDIGTPATAVAIAGIINGTGSAGAVVQEVLVPRLLEDSGGDMTSVFATLFIASVSSVLALVVLLIRSRRGFADI